MTKFTAKLKFVRTAQVSVGQLLRKPSGVVLATIKPMRFNLPLLLTTSP